METLSVIAQAVVVLGMIVLGVRTGGIGLGLWGVVGTGILIFGFGLEPGTAPVDAFFIIIAVITASSAMQAAGGIDFLVEVAAKIIRRNPKRLTYVAPIVAFIFTMVSGTSNIFYALIPVIYETAYRTGQRPERALASSTVTSGLGITASPVSAAMVAYMTCFSDKGIDFPMPKILAITLPAAIVACVATSFIQQRVGKELLDDKVFLQRVSAGEVSMPPVLAKAAAARQGKAGGVDRGQAADAGVGSAPAAGEPGAGGVEGDREPDGAEAGDAGQTNAGVSGAGGRYGKTSAMIFLVGVAVVVLFGLFPDLRPQVPADGGGTEALSMNTVIEILMFADALIIIVWCRIKPDNVMTQSLLRAGIVAAVALFGIAWMADTFVSNNTATVVDPLGSMVNTHPLLLAVALFLMTGLTTSQSTATRTIIPIALAAGMSPAIITALWPSLIGVWLFPANGSQIAAVATDKTGSTRLTSVPIWHSFTIPMLVSWGAVVVSGLLIAQLF